MTSIPEYINTLNPDQLLRCQELVEERLSELSKQKKVKLWYVVEDNDSIYFQSFDDCIKRLFRVYEQGYIKNTIKLIDYIFVYPEELKEYLEN